VRISILEFDLAALVIPAITAAVCANSSNWTRE